MNIFDFLRWFINILHKCTLYDERGFFVNFVKTSVEWNIFQKPLKKAHYNRPDKNLKTLKKSFRENLNSITDEASNIEDISFCLRYHFISKMK